MPSYHHPNLPQQSIESSQLDNLTIVNYGNRYQLGEFGGGYPNAKGYTDKKKYSSTIK